MQYGRKIWDETQPNKYFLLSILAKRMCVSTSKARIGIDNRKSLRYNSLLIY